MTRVPAVITDQVLTAIGDLGGDSVDPVQCVESQLGGSGAWVGRGGHEHEAHVGRGHQAIQSDGCAGDVAAEPLGGLEVGGRNALCSESGEARVHPAEQ